MFARVDIGKTEFPTKAAEKKVVEKLGLRFVSKVGVRIPFSMGNFHFFGRGKTNFWGGEGITSKLASQ